MKRSDSWLEEEIIDILYNIKRKKVSGKLNKDDEDELLESLKIIPEDNAIYCDDTVETVEDYIWDVHDYLSFATTEDKEEVLEYLEKK